MHFRLRLLLLVAFATGTVSFFSGVAAAQPTAAPHDDLTIIIRPVNPAPEAAPPAVEEPAPVLDTSKCALARYAVDAIFPVATPEADAPQRDSAGIADRDGGRSLADETAVVRDQAAPAAAVKLHVANDREVAQQRGARPRSRDRGVAAKPGDVTVRQAQAPKPTRKPADRATTTKATKAKVAKAAKAAKAKPHRAKAKQNRAKAKQHRASAAKQRGRSKGASTASVKQRRQNRAAKATQRQQTRAAKASSARRRVQTTAASRAAQKASARRQAQIRRSTAQVKRALRVATAKRRRAAIPAPPIIQVPVAEVRGILVHRRIAANTEALLAAADRANLRLNGWGYRSTQRQVQLRRQHCGKSRYAMYLMPSSRCWPATAPPGKSMHERGLAIDFYVEGRKGRPRPIAGTREFHWLQHNAAKYGFYNLPSEAWHWSTNGR